MIGIKKNVEKMKYPPWQELSIDMRLDLQRYLVPEKIDNLGDILTLIERSNSPLLVHESWIPFGHS